METRRYNVDEKIDHRTLREVYLRPFKVGLEARPWTIMTSYQKINDERVDTSIYLIERILREELAFEAVVMSDWGRGGLNDTIQSLLATTDLEMPGPAIRRGNRLMAAVLSDEVDEKTYLNLCVKRLLRLIEKETLLPARNGNWISRQDGHIDQQTEELEADDVSGFQTVARQAARDGLVLLKNQDLLSIRPQNLNTVAIIGPHAKQPTAGGSGNAAVNPYYIANPNEAIAAQLRGQNQNLNISFEQEMPVSRTPPTLGNQIVKLNPAYHGLRMNFYAGNSFEEGIVATSFWKDSHI
ncbi:Beta-glucosidase [Colletotrichum siamense]|uniref:beta-glucosidase n=1 Tax=Colletotrichum siamense TaxID=690259 RepID=A0A9P5EIM9_COLSI|nr:Beta-glucosidase [Colletotrichum siamense]KAF4840725.1 Beta-glucosidase [Colletotrichum siamense]